MPSLSAAPPSLTADHRHHHHRPSRLFIVLATSLTASLIILLLTIFLLYRKLSRNRTAPSETHQENPQKLPRRFSYSLLRRATASFSPSNRLGHGGFGSVYKAVLPSGLSVAVKIMDSPGSLQGEREFHNELSIASGLNNHNIVSLLGHSSDRRRRRLILVYELMPNRSLQDALFDRKCPELMPWRKRFEISLCIASALQYLHHFCNPPVIHGDIKPSNILLDADFEAKIGDFGLARLKSEEEDGGGGGGGDDGGRVRDVIGDNGSILEETESVLTSGFEENVAMDRLPDSCVVTVLDSPETVATPATDKVSLSEGNFDRISVESGKERKKGGSGRDWWWKQETAIDGSESGRVKDYVMEWIGNEIKKDRPKSEWVESESSIASSSGKMEQKKQKRRLEWWASLDEGRMRKKEKNRKKPREWWKEEFCEELTRKKKKKKELSSSSCRDLWWQRDEDSTKERKKKKINKNSKGSIDWWLDGLSGDLRNGRRNSLDGATTDIPKSGGISSTPSMRGTVCYIAPEYGGGGQISEKCDVYSFGVLLLVLVSGRRPLQVMASPISEFERANLISWARQLARNGKLLDLVDPSIHSLDKEQALLCITIALLCLQRSPSKRPTMKEIVAVLSGEAEPPHLPFEFSPSPPSNFLFKSQRKATR